MVAVYDFRLFFKESRFSSTASKPGGLARWFQFPNVPNTSSFGFSKRILLAFNIVSSQIVVSPAAWLVSDTFPGNRK